MKRPVKPDSDRRYRAQDRSPLAERASFRVRFPRLPQAVILFPAPYKTAIANLGFLTIWEKLNRISDFTCDRAVWDLQLSRDPRGLETGIPLSSFPLIFVSSSFDLDLIAFLDILSAAGIEPEARKRSPSNPIIVAGGMTLSLNPAPWSPFVDLAILGEGEQAVQKWVALYMKWREDGGSKRELITESQKLPFVWSPAAPNRKVLPATCRDYPEDPATSSVVHPEGHFGDCWLVEITRGCPRRCQFCAVCTAYPPRFANEEVILQRMEESNALNAPKIGLIGAATGDHPHLKVLIAGILKRNRQVTISSLRIEKTDDELLTLLVRGGLRTLTVAPEVGDEILRKKLGKRSSNDDLVNLARAAAQAGLRRLRLYFLIGLPDPEPPQKIVELISRMRRESGRGLQLDLRVSSFIPKPGTPWAAAAFAPTEYLNQVKRELRNAINEIPRCSVRFEPTKTERLTALFSRGNSELGEALLRARRSSRPLEQELRLSGVNLEDLLNPSLHPTHRRK